MAETWQYSRRQKQNLIGRHYWEIIADNLTKTAWRCCCVSSTDHQGQQFWVVAAEREDAGRFIVYADDMRIAFLELQTAIHRQLELA